MQDGKTSRLVRSSQLWLLFPHELGTSIFPMASIDDPPSPIYHPLSNLIENSISVLPSLPLFPTSSLLAAPSYLQTLVKAIREISDVLRALRSQQLLLYDHRKMAAIYWALDGAAEHKNHLEGIEQRTHRWGLQGRKLQLSWNKMWMAHK